MKLIEPSMEYDRQIQAYRQDFLDAGEPSDGTSSVLRYARTQDWLDRMALYARPETTPPDRVPCTQYLFVREDDGKIVGMLQLRHYLNEELEKYSGHIGYSVCPSERRKGYATQMLAAALEKCRERGLRRVMISCRPDNEGSRRTILHNGGVYESTVWYPEREYFLERYWIELVGVSPAV